MSRAQPAQRRPSPAETRAQTYAVKDLSQVRARRRAARLRRRLVRLDVAAGLVLAAVVLLASAGVAIAALIGLLLLAACGTSIAVERRVRRRARGAQRAYTAKKSRSSGSR